MEFKWDISRDVTEYDPILENHRVLIKADGVLTRCELPFEYLEGYPKIFKENGILYIMDKQTYSCEVFTETNYVTYHLKVCEGVPTFEKSISITDMENIMDIVAIAGNRLHKINRKLKEKEEAFEREVDILTYRI
jgi:hypothetical protein